MAYPLTYGSAEIRRKRRPKAVEHPAWPYVWPIVVFLLASISYIPAFNAGFIWDDPDFVTDNATLRTPQGLYQIWFQPTRSTSPRQYYPLVFTTMWFEYQLVGTAPFLYHFNNVLLHAIGCTLFWFALRRLNVPAAWLAAGLFALHPVHVESVAWVTERKDVLSGVFYFAALLAYIRTLGPYLKTSPAGTPTRGAFGDPLAGFDYRFYLLALLCYMCALFSKTITCSLPVALLLIIYWKRGRVTFYDLLPLIPFLIVGFIMGMVTALMEIKFVGAVGPEWDLTLIQRFLIAGRALCFYLWKLAWPYPLVFFYERWNVDPNVWWQWIFPVAVIIFVTTLWLLRRKIGRGPLVAMLYFMVTLFPALGFFNVFPMRYSFVADHFQYLASAAPIIWMAIGLKKLTDLVVEGHPYVAGIVLVPLFIMTWQQCQIYENLETLWRYTAAKSNDSWAAHNNLGNIMAARGEHADAVPHFLETTRLRPDLPEGYFNLANSMVATQRIQESIAMYQRAIQIDPKFAKGHHNLGVALVKLGLVAKAIPHFEKAAELVPDDPKMKESLDRTRAQAEAIQQERYRN